MRDPEDQKVPQYRYENNIYRINGENNRNKKLKRRKNSYKV